MAAPGLGGTHSPPRVEERTCRLPERSASSTTVSGLPTEACDLLELSSRSEAEESSNLVAIYSDLMPHGTITLSVFPNNATARKRAEHPAGLVCDRHVGMLHVLGSVKFGQECLEVGVVDVIAHVAVPVSQDRGH